MPRRRAAARQREDRERQEQDDHDVAQRGAFMRDESTALGERAGELGGERGRGGRAAPVGRRRAPPRRPPPPARRRSGSPTPKCVWMYRHVRRRLLELLAQLAHEHVDRAVAAGHRVAPDPLVDLLALEHAALGVGEQLDQLELAPRQVDRAAVRRRPGTGRRGSRPRRPRSGAAAGASARRRRRTTASTRAMTSSGWHGLVTQSSAPIRSPRTRWATVDCPVHTTTPAPGSSRHSLSRYSHACGPSIARSMTTRAQRASRRAASIGTALASTRCSQPRRSMRLVSTWRKPESPSRTATRSGGRRCARSSEEESSASRRDGTEHPVTARSHARCGDFSPRRRSAASRSPRTRGTGRSRRTRPARRCRPRCRRCARTQRATSVMCIAHSRTS